MNTTFSSSSKAVAGLLLFSTIAGGIAGCTAETPVVPSGDTAPQSAAPSTPQSTPKSAKTDKADAPQSNKGVSKPKPAFPSTPAPTVAPQHQDTDQGTSQADSHTSSPTFGTFNPISSPSVDPVLVAKQIEWSTASTLLEDARQTLKDKQQALTNAKAAQAKAESRLEKAIAAQAAAQKTFDEVNAAHPGAADKLAKAKENLDKANDALAKAKKTQSDVTTRLTHAQGTLSDAQNTLSNAKSAVADARQKFNDAKATLEALTASSDTKIEAEKVAKAALDTITPEYESKVEDLKEKQALLTNAQTALANSKANLAAAKKAAESASINWGALSHAEKQELVKVFLAEIVNDYRAAAGYTTPAVRFAKGDENAQWFADYAKAHPLTEDQLVGLEPVTDPNRSTRNPVHSNLNLPRYSGTHEGYTFRVTGENYAGSRPDADPLTIAVEAFKGLRMSPEHEAIFLNPKVNAQSIGIVQSSNGTWNVIWQGYTVTNAPEGGVYTTDVENTYGIDVWQGKSTPEVLNTQNQPCVGSSAAKCQVVPAGTTVEKTPVDPAFTGKVDLAPYRKAVETAEGTVITAQDAHDKAAAALAPVEKTYNAAKSTHDKAVAALNSSAEDVAKATADKAAAEAALTKAEGAVPVAEKAVETATAAIPAAEKAVEDANGEVAAAETSQATASTEHQAATTEAAPVVEAQGTLDAANKELSTATSGGTAASNSVDAAETALTSAQDNVVKAANRYEAAGSALGFNVDAPENN